MSVDAGLTVPKAIASSRELTPGAKLVYSALCFFASKTGGNGNECSLEQKELSTCVGQSVRSIQNHLRDLTEKGLIQMTLPKTSKIYTYHLLPRSRRVNGHGKASYSTVDPLAHVQAPAIARAAVR